jgi:uncharacterized protein YjdB
MKLKRIASIVLTVVMVLALSVTASASKLDDNAKSVKLNTTYKATLSGDSVENIYKFTVGSSTTLTVTLYTEFDSCEVFLYNSDGESMKSLEKEAKSGSWSTYGGSILHNGNFLEWDSKIDSATGTISYKVPKGTYYLQLYINRSSVNENIAKFKISDPNASSVTALSLQLEMEAGDSIKLGSIVAPASSKVTWKSSDTEVATVSSTGEVTAVAAGTAKITATSGGKTASIQVVVT